MADCSNPEKERRFQRRAVDAAIRISLLAGLVVWCFNIVRPFLLPVLWGAILAVAIYPLFLRLRALLGGREKLASVLITLVALAILITPTVMLTDSLVHRSKNLAAEIEAGTLSVPPPPAKVRQWPVVGERLYEAWSLSSTNLEAALEQFKPQVAAASKFLLRTAAGAGKGILMFVVSILIAGALLVYARNSSAAMETIATRLLGDKAGRELVDIAGATIRSVAQGVLGVALIQAVLASIGLIVMGVPYAGLWTLLVLLLAIVQLPPLLILAPIIVYVFSVADTTPAILFMIWSTLVSVSDAFLKPLFLGRGMDIPMLVVLMGAIGGMILSGIIGLFVGAVVLAVGYTLFVAWLEQGRVDSDPTAAGT
ncbi:MAG TPA: AI-2E family transporter [Gammaproteobacteria bacterium]|nr:AI-2E family transporter [Gammaproteobacteria bacterium]